MTARREPQLRTWRPSTLIGWALVSMGAALIVVLAIALIHMVHRVDYDGIGVLGFFALLFPPQLLIIAALAVLVSWLAWRRRSGLAAITFAIVALLAAPMAIWPIASMLRYADEQGVEVSLAAAFLPDVTLGGVELDKSVTFATIEGRDLMLDVWRTDVQSVGLHPAILRIHGGAWIHGTRSELSAWNVWLNQLGYQVFDVDYRMPPPARWQDEIADVKCALGWVVAHAEEYRVDPNRLSVLGYSAGAHLAMIAAYTKGDAMLPSSCAYPEASVRSVVNIYGPADLKLGYYGGGSLRYVQDAMNQFIGGPPEAYPDRYLAISPVTHVRATTPPTITLLGTSDRIVPVEQADVLTHRLAAAGVAHETYLLPANDHGFDANWSSLGAQFARAKIEAFLKKYDNPANQPLAASR